jgi:protein-disulfide isomerase
LHRGSFGFAQDRLFDSVWRKFAPNYAQDDRVEEEWSGLVHEIIGVVLKGVRPLRCLALIASVAALGCHAQTSVPAGGAQAVQVGVKLTPEMARRVEVMIRNKAQLSLDYAISIGEPSKVEIAGYDQIVVTFTADGKPNKSAEFLLSDDGRTLAQFTKFDLSQDPKDKVSAAGRPARGGAQNAPVLIVGYDDLECPYCAKMNAEIFPALLDRYKDQVRVVYRDFPLYEIHPWAMHAAIDANCLGASSTAGYWNFIDTVHLHADELAGAEKTAAKADATLDKLALDEGARQKVNAAELAACVQKQDDSKVKASVEEAKGEPLRVDSTPVLFINGEKVEGVVPIETLDRIIDGALIAAGKTPPPPVSPPPAAPVTAPARPAAKPGS